LWYIIKSYLFKKRDKTRIMNWAKQQSFVGPWMPQSYEFDDVYLGEYPWAPAFLHRHASDDNHEDWTNRSRGNHRIPAKLLVTDDEYLSSGSSIDCSTLDSIRVKLPAKYLVDEMNLDEPYIDGRFFDASGDLAAFDPGVFSSDIPRYLLIRKDKLAAFLQATGCSILWTLLGEKNLIGGGVPGQPLGWLEINGAYTFIDNKVDGSLRASFLSSR
jgi:hypothetical protein